MLFMWHSGFSYFWVSRFFDKNNSSVISNVLTSFSLLTTKKWSISWGDVIESRYNIMYLCINKTEHLNWILIFSCLNKLCDPVEAAITEVTDLMICAPWTSQTFSCLTNGIDHTDCCKSQGLPDSCLNLCSGNISQIDFSYFKWVHDYIPGRNYTLFEL